MYLEERSDYYMWLLDRVDMSRNYGEYSEFLDMLFSTEFYYAFVKDENRASAGKNLRSLYAMEIGVDVEDVQTGPCTVLEMLIALAEDFSNYSGENESKCFWELITNLGLSNCSNDVIDKNYILNRLTDWMGHCYKPNGEGSLFPMKYFDGDVRNMEIWNQMNAYILENYPVR